MNLANVQVADVGDYTVRVSNPAGAVTFGGYVVVQSNTLVSYYYEYVANCSMASTPIRTPSQSLLGNGQPQIANPSTVTGLSNGDYCYRLVSQAHGGALTYGNFEPFSVTNVYNMVATEPVLVVPATNSCVIFRGNAYIPPGSNVSYYYRFGSSLDQSTWQNVLSTPVHGSTGQESAQPIQVCNLPPGQYYYDLVAVVNPGIPSEYTLYGGMQQFTLTPVSVFISYYLCTLLAKAHLADTPLSLSLPSLHVP